MDYFYKYQKYKAKYLNLKNRSNGRLMKGGGDEVPKYSIENAIQEIWDQRDTIKKDFDERMKSVKTDEERVALLNYIISLIN